MSSDNFIQKKSGPGPGSLLFLSFFILSLSTVLLKAQVPDKGSAFTAKLINIEAAVHETFRYNTTLHNTDSKTHIYELKAKTPDGWNVVFRARGSQVTSLNMEGNKSEEITIEIHPAYSAEPSKYKIPIIASAENETLQLDLEAVVKGSYGIELTTPTGRLSDDITEGSQEEIHLVVKNTGTLPLDDISLSAQTPSKWDATFEPTKIEHLEAGKTVDVKATLKVPDKTIAGDYISTFSAKNASSSAQATFRMTVKTSLLSGWIGILVILASIALVIYLIRKYGRR